jgi:beta-galactosidase/beta-glucuronidase
MHVCTQLTHAGNESGYGSVHDDMARYIRGKDPSRVLMYEPASFGPRTASAVNCPSPAARLATDILCPMYARIQDLAQLGNMFPNMPIIQVSFHSLTHLFIRSMTS